MDSEEKLQKLVAKRTALTENLLQMKKDRNKHMREAEKVSHQMKETVMTIKHISQSIGQLKGEYQGIRVSGKVSDHAIVRYLERYKGIDMLQVVSEILEHPDRRYSGDDMITTIFPNDQIMDEQTKKDIKHVLQRHDKSKTGANNG